MKFTKNDLVSCTSATILKDKDESFEISTDSRQIRKGDIYLPLKGETFDGETFIDDSVEKGCKAYFTSKNYINEKADLILHVKDTLTAYLDIAKFYRKKVNPKVVAITGSSGKTTTKEMLYSVLSQKYKTHKTFSNHNNEIGFCQTVLSMDKDTEFLIVEMGMRGLGEIELISKYSEPDFAIITNCGSAHLGRLGSLENIAKAKCEIVSGMKDTGILYAKDQAITKKVLQFSGKTQYYSNDDVEILEQNSNYSKFKYRNEIFELNIAGDYNIENSLGIIDLALQIQMPIESIKKGLKEYKPIEKRWEKETVNSLNFINDSYNANPDSMKASVKTFVENFSNPIVVLGDMGELGKDEKELHRQVGEYLAQLKFDAKYVLVGNLAKEIGKELEKADFEVFYFENIDNVADFLFKNCNADDTIFLKASRFMKFENIIERIKKGTCKL